MECLVNNKKLECNFYEERKCEVLGIKSPGYDECMLAEYDKMGFDLESFCLKHYDASSYKVWTSAEQQSNAYLNQKYECLVNAGVTKGKTFCDDKKQIALDFSQLEVYNCYIENGVLNSTFADKRCNLIHPKNDPTQEVRDSYQLCMTQSGQNVEDDPKFVCDNEYPWKRDDFFI